MRCFQAAPASLGRAVPGPGASACSLPTHQALVPPGSLTPTPKGTSPSAKRLCLVAVPCWATKPTKKPCSLPREQALGAPEAAAPIAFYQRNPFLTAYDCFLFFFSVAAVKEGRTPEQQSKPQLFYRELQPWQNRASPDWPLHEGAPGAAVLRCGRASAAAGGEETAEPRCKAPGLFFTPQSRAWGSAPGTVVRSPPLHLSLLAPSLSLASLPVFLRQLDLGEENNPNILIS